MPRCSPSLNCFEAVGSVLDRLCSIEKERQRIDLTALGEKVSLGLETIKSQYRINKPPLIPFEDPIYRMAYLYWAAGINALAMENVLQTDNDLQEWLAQRLKKRGYLNVCSIGGGPGSEILGLAKWIERTFADPVELNCHITDKVPEWGETALTLIGEINQKASSTSQQSRSLPSLRIKGTFAEVDVQCWEHLQRIKNGKGYDLIIISYLFSHLFSRPQLSKFNAFMDKVVSGAHTESRFIAVERDANSEYWKSRVRKMAEFAKLQLSDFKQIPFPKGDEIENEANLGCLYKVIGNCTGTSRNAFWVVGRKV